MATTEMDYENENGDRFEGQFNPLRLVELT